MKRKKCRNQFKEVTHEIVNQSFKSEGYKLLTVYTNAFQLLDFECPNGHHHKIKWNDWQGGHRCRKCYDDKMKPKYDNIKTTIEADFYQLISTEYINKYQKLETICPDGHLYKTTWNNWKAGHRCSECNPKWSKQEKKILNYVKKKYSGRIEENNRTLIQNPKTDNYLELDIWLPEIKKAIEYNGEYYHKDEYSQWKDNYKQQWCKENNIDLLIIDEDKWVKNKDWNMINNFINERRNND